MAEVSAQGWINFQASPFGLTDFFLAIGLIGTLFAIIALFDGIRFDDVILVTAENTKTLNC